MEFNKSNKTLSYFINGLYINLNDIEDDIELSPCAIFLKSDDQIIFKLIK